MRIQDAYQSLRQALIPLYQDREAAAIAAMVTEKITGYTRAALLIHGQDELNPEQQDWFARSQEELLAWRPVQYVLNEAWFADMPFQVDERVLIPRPETEELVAWIAGLCQQRGVASVSPVGANAAGSPVSTPGQGTVQTAGEPLRILDIGTGSGCIAIALKKKCPDAQVWALDKSTDALALARTNSETLGYAVQFLQGDILESATESILPELDIIVSNPPYVPHRDAAAMRPNVRQYEPALALFVDDEDPLLFYRVIARVGLAKLVSGGRVFFEIHTEAGRAVTDLLHELGYTQVDLRSDLAGHHRMISAIRP